MSAAPLRILLAGATGKSGKALAAEILKTKDLQLVAAVSRSAAGTNLDASPVAAPINVPVFASVEDALNIPSDIFIDYTAPDIVKRNVLAALTAKRHIVIGTSGLSSEDYSEIDKAALKAGQGAIAAGNFSIIATLLRRFALEASKYIPDFEIIDYASAHKPDAPSGTARELAEFLSAERQPSTSLPVDDIFGLKETRGAAVGGAQPVQVHSLRLPSYYISCEAIFGAPDARLTLRYDAIPGLSTSAPSYVMGTLLAARKVSSFVGLKRGLESVIDA